MPTVAPWKFWWHDIPVLNIRGRPLEGGGTTKSWRREFKSDETLLPQSASLTAPPEEEPTHKKILINFFCSWVDAHIDPRSEENRLGSLLRELDRRSRLRGFLKVCWNLLNYLIFNPASLTTEGIKKKADSMYADKLACLQKNRPKSKNDSDLLWWRWR